MMNFLISICKNIVIGVAVKLTIYGIICICDEFLNIISVKVRFEIVAKTNSALYYSIIVDSIPDVSHTDQLTVIINYVLPKGRIKERFIPLIPIQKAQLIIDTKWFAMADAVAAFNAGFHHIKKLNKIVTDENEKQVTIE
uniref:DUF4371 domain-containing protein n=1 Tax=Anopheles funestus TaxID=62324 RepID=A0A182RWH9_ANOFN